VQSRQPLRPGGARGVRMMSLKDHILKHASMRPNPEAALAHSWKGACSTSYQPTKGGLHFIFILAPGHMPNSATRFWIWHCISRKPKKKKKEGQSHQAGSLHGSV
jgi:hypothetical protein